MKKFLLVLIICVFSTGAYAAGGDILARVGDKVLTRADFDSLVSYYSTEKKKDLSKDDGFKKDLLDILVKRMAFAYVAQKKGIDKNVEAANLINLYRNGILMSELIKEEVTDKVTISDQDIELYYKMHADEFKHPELVKIGDILVKTKPDMSDADRAKAKAKAEDVLKKIREGREFAKLAPKYSDDMRSRLNGGDLGYVRKGMLPKTLEDAVFSLKPGEVSGVLEIPDGYCIIKVEGKEPAGVWPLDKVKEEVRKKALEQVKNGRTADFTEKVMKEAGVEVHPDLVMGQK